MTRLDNIEKNHKYHDTYHDCHREVTWLTQKLRECETYLKKQSNIKIGDSLIMADIEALDLLKSIREDTNGQNDSDIRGEE